MRIPLVAPPPMKRGAWIPTDALVTESILAEEYNLLAEKLNISFVDARRWSIDCLSLFDTKKHRKEAQL